MNSCEQIWDVLSLYADGHASVDQRRIVERHVDLCVSCAADLEFMQKTSSTMEEFLLIEPPVSLRQSILDVTVFRQPWYARFGLSQIRMGWATSGALVSAGAIAVLFLNLSAENGRLSFGKGVLSGAIASNVPTLNSPSISHEINLDLLNSAAIDKRSSILSGTNNSGAASNRGNRLETAMLIRKSSPIIALPSLNRPGSLVTRSNIRPVDLLTKIHPQPHSDDFGLHSEPVAAMPRDTEIVPKTVETKAGAAAAGVVNSVETAETTLPLPSAHITLASSVAGSDNSSYVTLADLRKSLRSQSSVVMPEIQMFQKKELLEVYKSKY